MILTKEQVEKRLNSEKNISNLISSEDNKVEVIYKDGINNHIGNPGAKHLTERERVAIGVLTKTTGAETASLLFGVSKSHAQDLGSGNRNVSDTNLRIRDQNLINQIDERLESTKLSIQERAAEKLLGALGLLTNEKLENSSVKEIAQVSSQLSQVVRNITGNSNNKETGKQNVKIIVHQPKASREDFFDVVEIGVE